MKNHWKITGFIATAIVVLAFPLYVLKAVYFDGYGTEPVENAKPHFVGSKNCIDCHNVEYELWLQSDHYFAMDTASDESVLGDFDNATFERNGRIHKFYKKDDRFLVYTDGADGIMQEFEVEYTFGAWPLQQYLVPFPDGKYQTLALTWDTIKKQWYHMADAVYEGQVVDHSNWLHWTNQAQNWNGMCADCHSTNLKKGFDSEMNTFNTTWSEISVGCEACHGPASDHLNWAKLPELARPGNINTGLQVQTSNINNFKYVDQCARCHARRSTLQDYDYEWHDLLDQMIPTLAHEPNYFTDGQILDEDYVYGSFVQSKMYMNDVKCNDCHNVHSGKLVLQGNDLCLQCHRSDIYDAYNHHFHKQKGEPGNPVISEFGDTYEVGDGASCINCHMPGRYYMGVDYRRDHSFRIPRPEFSDVLGTPNSCTYCHADKSNTWASSFMTKWYGQNNKAHYGSMIARYVNQNDEDAFIKLSGIIDDDLYPPHLRATALHHLARMDRLNSKPFLKNKLDDMESIVRHTAITEYLLDSIEDIDIIIPLLNDPVRAIRFEAAIRLSEIPEDQIPKQSRKALKDALEEYRVAMEYSADFSASRHNLGNFYNNKGDLEKAIYNYTEAIKIDDKFFPAKVNLAMAYNKAGDNIKAEITLKDVVGNHPDQSQVKYSLGLLLAEMQKYEEAAIYLQQAATEIPDHARANYNLGQILDFLGKPKEAEIALVKATELEPGNVNFLIALMQFYLKQENFKEAKPIALSIKQLNPGDPSIDQALQFIDSKLIE